MKGYENIQTELNTSEQIRANSHDQCGPVHTPAAGPIIPVEGARAACDAIRKTLPYLTGETEEAAIRQLDACDE